MALQPHQQLGRNGEYMLERQLGQGGFAEVWLASHGLLLRNGGPWSREHRVALKIAFDNPMLAETDPNWKKRFFQEARALQEIRHPNVVSVYKDLGEVEKRPFFVMEYLPGGTLSDRLLRGRVDIQDAITITAEVLSGLDAVHQYGAVHRDIKPSNIAFDDPGRAKLLDLGIARLTAGPRLTKSLALLGSPGYMSPEQCNGEPIDSRSDIYSVGCVLYQMLTGRTPFSGTDLAVIGYHLRSRPVPPSQIEAKVSDRLSEIVMKCLEKKASDRYSTLTELAGDLGDARPAAISVSSQDDEADWDKWLEMKLDELFTARATNSATPRNVVETAPARTAMTETNGVPAETLHGQSQGNVYSRPVTHQSNQRVVRSVGTRQPRRRPASGFGFKQIAWLQFQLLVMAGIFGISCLGLYTFVVSYGLSLTQLVLVAGCAIGAVCAGGYVLLNRLQFYELIGKDRRYLAVARWDEAPTYAIYNEARRRGVRGRSRMNREELLEAMRAVHHG